MSKLLGIDAGALPAASAAGSDEPTSPRSSVISSVNTDEMLEPEDAALPVRVFDLEKVVRDQQDEIAFLKATVADLQRRLNVVDGSRGVSKLTAGSGVRSSSHRQTNGSYTPQNGVGRGDTVRRRTPSATQRRPYHHQSTGSLHSDGQSSHSGSPATSPSPTYLQQRHLQSGRPAAATVAPHLTKRWNSTSDFQAPRRSPAPGPTPAISLRRPATGRAVVGGRRRPESYAGISAFSSQLLPEEPADVRRHEAESAAPPAPRRTLSGSMTNLNRSSPMRNGGSREMTYSAEDGVLKAFVRGRPVTLFAPTSLRDDYTTAEPGPPPQAKLKLEWVYGYRGKDCRNNLSLLPTGEMVYFTAAVVVLYNVEDQLQRHYTGHTDDVKCLSIHPNRFTVASGQSSGAGSQAQVRVWDSVSLNTLHVLGEGTLERSVSCLSFSQQDGGALLAVVDEAQERTLSVWEWQRAVKLIENKAAMEPVLDVKWHPLDRGVLMTCGRQHVNFWLLEAGTLMRRQGVFGARERPRYVTCMAFTDCGDLITGDSEGRIQMWERGGNQVARTIRAAHDGAVFALFVDKTGSVVSGGKDGKVVQWDRSLTRTGNVMELSEALGAARVLSRGRGHQLLIGTTRNCILTGDWEVLPRTVVSGHTDEVQAVATHPERPQFVTGGWDGRLVFWDVMTHAPLATIDMEAGVQCAAFSADGSRLLVGLVTGFWHVLDADTRETTFSRQEGTDPIQVAAHSPDGSLVALGSRSNSIFIYQRSGHGYSRLAKCMGHSSAVTHLDWSLDGSLLRTNSADLELLFWTAISGRQVTQPAHMRDVQWATHSCTLAFHSAGIFPENGDGADVNTCARSQHGHLLASGDELGKVKLYSYPACWPKSQHQSCRGHSGHVTQVSFFSEDSRLVSTGGRDTSVIQWTVE